MFYQWGNCFIYVTSLTPILNFFIQVISNFLEKVMDGQKKNALDLMLSKIELNLENEIHGIILFLKESQGQCIYIGFVILG